jgi:hypothetical protein
MKANYLPHLAGRVFGVPLLIPPQKSRVILQAIGPRLGLGQAEIEGLSKRRLGRTRRCGRPCSNRLRSCATRTRKATDKKRRTAGRDATWKFGSPGWIRTTTRDYRAAQRLQPSSLPPEPDQLLRMLERLGSHALA